MVIDQLTKKKHYILYTIDKNGTIAKTITYLLSNNVWKLHSLLLLLNSNQNPQFTSRV